MDNQSIIQITTILHPNLMFLFWRQLRLFVHWRECVIKIVYYSKIIICNYKENALILSYKQDEYFIQVENIPRNHMSAIIILLVYYIILSYKMLTKFTSFSSSPSKFSLKFEVIIIWVLILFSSLISCQTQQPKYQLMISTSNSMASSRSNFTFQIVQQEDVNLTSNTAVQIIFPTDYQGILSNGNYVCYIGSWIDSIAIPSVACTLSGLTMTITGGFVDIIGTIVVPAYTFYQIIINELTNPMYATTTAAFTGLFQNTNTNQAIFNFETNFGISGITIIQGLLTCSITSNPTTTTSSAAMIITMSAPLIIPLNTSLTISLPNYWPTNAVNISTIISSASCQSIENTSSSIQCTMVTKPTAIQINVINLVASDISSGIKFSVLSITNPPTTQPQGSINIVAKKDGSKSMARCSGVKMTGITPINFFTASFTVDNYLVNALTTGFLVFKVNSLVKVDDIIQIQFPPYISAQNILSYIKIPNGNGIDYTPAITYNTTTQTTKISTKGALAVSGASIQVQFYSIKNPPSQAVTSSINLSLKRNGYLMEQLNTVTNPLSFKARRGAITGSVSVSSTEAGTVADYTFDVQLSNQISSSVNSLIIVYFPTLYSGSVTGLSACIPSCLTLTSTAAIFQASSINSLTSTSLTCTFQITGLTNPVQIGITTSFRIVSQLYQSNSLSIVDQITSGLSVNLTSRQITTITLSSDSSIVYHYPTTLTISAVNNNIIPAFSALLVVVPSSITIQQASISCLLGTRSVPCNYNSTTYSISVTSISAIAIGFGQLQTLTINNLFNPSSTVPTSSFKFYILNQYNQIIQHKQSGLTFQATIPTKFTSLSLTPSSTTNSDNSTSMYIGFSLPMQAGYLNSSVLGIIFPNHMNNIGSTTCLSVTSNLLNIGCTKSVNQVQVTLTYSGTVTAGSEVGFKIQFYQNYPTIQPYSILLTLYTSVTQQFLIAQDTVTKVNTILSSIVVNSYSFSNGILVQTTTLTLSLTPAYSGTQLNQIIITFPNQFTISGGSCPSLPTGLTCSVTTNIFAITRSSISYSWVMPLQFSLSGIIAPTYTPSTSLIIQTKSTQDYLISRDMSIKFTTACSLPCRTCAISSSTSCQSCYSNPVLVSSKTMLDTSISQCVAACANKFYFNNSTNQCQACSSNCQLCVSYSYCTSCPSLLLLYRINNTCVSNCPFGYYPSSFFTCQQCSAALHCASCSNQFQCATCVSGYYFYQNLCLQSCPSPISYTNTILNTCDSCPTNCTKCTGSLTVSNSTIACTQCQASYLLDISTQRCYQQCLIPGTVPNGNQCVSCQIPCITCSITSSNCTSCDTSTVNKYLHNNRCLSICPSLYYASDSTFTCLLCTSPCQTCTTGSISSCQTCVSGYYLYNNTCIQTCPNLYYPNGYQCLACVSPCMNCLSQLQCSSCISGKYLYGSSCVTTCDPGMTVINGNQCLVCASSCRTCSSSNYCTSCYPTNYLYDGTCSTLCPNATYRDSVSETCVACNAPCSQCSSLSYCITCINTLQHIQSGNCVSSCSGNLIPINNVCTACLANCLTCQGALNNCIRCSSGYYYVYGGILPNCVGSCSSGYIYNNVTNAGNNQCLASCPASYYASSFGTNCQSCPTGCSICTNSAANCSFCASSYYLYTPNTTCLLVCPSNAPYQTLSTNISLSNTCSICNMSICFSCQIINSCNSCLLPYLLVFEGITYRINPISQNKTCIVSCPTNSVYNSTQYLCIVTQKNETNNTNTTTTTNVWKYKLIPNYLFAFILLGILPIVGISKFQVITTNFKVCFYVICALLCAGVTAHVFYFEAIQILGVNKISSTTTTSTYIGSLYISLQNPTTIISLLMLGTHLVGTLALLLGLICIKDYSLIPVLQQHPIISFLLLLLFIVQYKTIWIFHCGIFGIQMFMIKYCKQSMVRLVKGIAIVGILQFMMGIVYGIFVIVLTSQTLSGNARLLLSSISIPNEIGYIHPYIQLAVMSTLCLFTSISLILTNRQQYFIQKVPELDHGLLPENQKTKISKLSQANASMNELLSQKDAVQKRFSNSDMYRDIQSNQIISDEDILYDFGTRSNKDKLSSFEQDKITKIASRLSKISSKTILSKISIPTSKIEKKETAQINIQVNMDELMLPKIDEQDALSNRNNGQKNRQQQQKENRQQPGTEIKKQNISNIQEEHFSSNIPLLIVSDNAKQQQQKQKQILDKQQVKSQPSWTSFKLGTKYKKQLSEEQQIVGLPQNQTINTHRPIYDTGMKILNFQQQQQQSIQSLQQSQQKSHQLLQQSFAQSIYNPRNNTVNTNRTNVDDRLIITNHEEEISQIMHNNRQQQQDYQEQIQLTKNIIHKEQPSEKQQSKELSQDKQLQESRQNNQQEHQGISQQSQSAKNNIFYFQQGQQQQEQQLLSENIPEQFRPRPPTQQSGVFVPFGDVDSCLVQQSVNEQNIDIYLNIENNCNNLQEQQKQEQQKQIGDQRQQQWNKQQKYNKQQQNKQQYVIEQQQQVGQYQTAKLKKQTIENNQNISLKHKEINQQDNQQDKTNNQHLLQQLKQSISQQNNKQQKQQQQFEQQHKKQEKVQQYQQQQLQQQYLQQQPIQQLKQLQKVQQQKKQYKQQDKLQPIQHQQIIKLTKNPQLLLSKLRSKRTIKNSITNTADPLNSLNSKTTISQPKIENILGEQDDHKIDKSIRQVSIKSTINKPNSISESKRQEKNKNKTNEPAQRDTPASNNDTMNKQQSMQQSVKSKRSNVYNDQGEGVDGEEHKINYHLIQSQKSQIKEDSQMKERQYEQKQQQYIQKQEQVEAQVQVQEQEQYVQQQEIIYIEQQKSQEENHQQKTFEIKQQIQKEKTQILNRQQNNKNYIQPINQTRNKSRQQSNRSKYKQLTNNHQFPQIYDNEQQQIGQQKQSKIFDNKIIKETIRKIKHRQQRSQILIPLNKQTQNPPNKQLQQNKPLYHIKPDPSDNITQIATYKNRMKEKKKVDIEYDDAEHYQIKNNIVNTNKQVDFIYKTPSQMGSIIHVHVADDEHKQTNDQVQMQEKSKQKEQMMQKKQKQEQIKQVISQKQKQKQKHKGITFIQDLQQLDQIVKTPIKTIGKPRKNPSSIMNKHLIQADIKPSQYINTKRQTKPNRSIDNSNTLSNRQYYNSESSNRNSFTDRQLYNEAQSRQNIQNKKQTDNKLPIGIIYQEQDAQYKDNYQKNKVYLGHKSKDNNPISMNTNKLYNYQSLSIDNTNPTNRSNKKNRYGERMDSDKKPSVMLRGSFKKIGEHILKGDHQN